MCVITSEQSNSKLVIVCYTAVAYLEDCIEQAQQSNFSESSSLFCFTLNSVTFSPRPAKGPRSRHTRSGNHAFVPRGHAPLPHNRSAGLQLCSHFNLSGSFWLKRHQICLIPIQKEYVKISEYS